MWLGLAPDWAQGSAKVGSRPLRTQQGRAALYKQDVTSLFRPGALGLPEGCNPGESLPGQDPFVLHFWLSSDPGMPLLLLPSQGYLPGNVVPEVWHLSTHAHLLQLQPRSDSDLRGPYGHVFIESLLCAKLVVGPWGYVLILSSGMHTSPTAQTLAFLRFHLSHES